MIRSFRLLLIVALSGLGTFSSARAQTPTTLPANPTPLVDPLPGLPRPPDEPRSLMQPPAMPLYANADVMGSVLEHNMMLDPPQLPQPGWFVEGDVSFLVPHLKTNLSNTVPLGPYLDTVALTNADLHWVGSPHLEGGYRLPGGLGEFSLGYRYFGSDGATVTPSPDGFAFLHSQLSMNQLNLDYRTREISLWPKWDMSWSVGVRTAWIYFDSRADESFDEAAQGSGVYEQRVSNSFWGIGPHVGLELARRLDTNGLTFVGRVDVTDLLGRIRQGYFESSLIAGPNGLPLNGETRVSGSQDVPVLSTQIGLQWQPQAYPNMYLFLGYQYEYWWNVGKVSNVGTTGELSDQGIMLKMVFDF